MSYLVVSLSSGNVLHANRYPGGEGMALILPFICLIP